MSMPSLAAAVVFVVALVVSSLGIAQNPGRAPKPLPGSPSPLAPTAPATPGPSGQALNPKLPTLRLGALLPLTGASAWYAEEMRRGMELAVAEVNPAPRSPQSTPAPVASPGGEPRIPPTEQGAAQEPPPSAPFQLALDVLDVHPLNIKDAGSDFARLAAAGATVVFTASATPTLAIYPLAASRDILVVHQGLPSERLPSASQTLLQTRPSAAARADALAAYAWERGIRRLALLGAGDEFGKAVRASLSARWRDRGTPLALAESLSLDAPDLRTRLTRVARLAPEAVCLAFRGQDLGELARRLREAGYTGLLLALDDDRAALLAAGPALTDMILLVEAFVPESDPRGSRFAQAYEARFRRPPSRVAANAYDAVAIIAEGTRLAFREGRLPGGARLREALLARRTFPSVLGRQLEIRDDGTLERPFALFTVEHGRPVFVRYVTPSGRPATEESLAPARDRDSASAR